MRWRGGESREKVTDGGGRGEGREERVFMICTNVSKN